MSDTKASTSGTKRKSSGSDGGSKKKNAKLCDNNASMNSTEKLFNNEVCIRTILSKLSLEDLANVSRASHFLKMNAIIIFKTIHAATIEIVYDGNDFPKHQLVFQQFGSVATKVNVSTLVDDEDEDDEGEDPFCDDGGKILRTIGHFCGSNLLDLTLSRLRIQLSSKDYNAKNRIEIRNVLAALKKNKLINDCIKGQFLVWAQALQELSIQSSCHLEKLPEIATLPQLKILHIGACPFWPLIPGENFCEFLRKNPSIEEVDYHFNIMNDGHLESICSLPKLTQLKLIMIKFDRKDFSLIANVRKLEKLELHVHPSDHRLFSNLRNILPTGCEYSVESVEFVPLIDVE